MSLKKKALMIIPSYDLLPEEKWLPGAEKDAQAMKTILLEKFAFEESNVKLLQGQQATKETIIETLKSLTQEADSNSVVFLYYSGHGVYLPHSQDEGLLPTLKSFPIQGPTRDACITGRDLLPFLDALSKKKAKCFLIFDCCHSGQLYRVAELASNESLRPKQVILRSYGDEAEPKKYTKADRGGWTPEDKDHFVSIAACNTVQVASEEIGNGGYLTMAIENVVNRLENPGSLSYEAFFRLIEQEFKRKEWDKHQTPQLEGSNLNNVLFSDSKVTPVERGILIKKKINTQEFVLGAGFLQNLRAGTYDVFEATASEETVKEGSRSKDWMGTIRVIEDQIEPVEAFGTIAEQAKDKEITYGCLAYLKEVNNITNGVFINIPVQGEDCQKIQELSKHLNATNMFTVTNTKPSEKNQDRFINITLEKFNEYSEKCFVARRGGQMIVPSIGIAYGEIMAGNLDRYHRFNIALERAKSPSIRKDDRLDNVSLKMFKINNVDPYTKYSRQKRIQEGLQGKEISQVSEQRPIFVATQKGAVVTRENGNNGDAFVFQVENHNIKKEDTVHICILYFAFDGSIQPLYPKNEGRTIELRGGDTAEGIARLSIPEGALRAMTEPDLSKDEPESAVETLVLYAASAPVHFGPLTQTAIKQDPASRGTVAKGDFRSDALGDLKKFLRVTTRNVDDDDLLADVKLFVQPFELTVQK